MLTEPVTCSTCGAVSVNGGTLHCHGCYSVLTNQRVILETRIAELEEALREECRKHEQEGFFDTPSHKILNHKP